MLMKLSIKIKNLNENMSELKKEEVEKELLGIEKLINKILSTDKFLVRKPVEELLIDVSRLKNELNEINKKEFKETMDKIYNKIGEILDQQMMSEIGGAGEYFRNMREASKKRKEQKK